MGWAVAEVDIRRADIATVLELGVSATERSVGTPVRQTSEHLRRARFQASALSRIVTRHRPDVVAIEMTGLTQYAIPSFGFGVMIGLAASLTLPIIELSPREVKRAVKPHGNVTKAEVLAWALTQKYAKGVNWPTGRANKINLTWMGRPLAKLAEHAGDALATIPAAVATEQFKLLTRLG